MQLRAGGVAAGTAA